MHERHDNSEAVREESARGRLYSFCCGADLWDRPNYVHLVRGGSSTFGMPLPFALSLSHAFKGTFTPTVTKDYFNICFSIICLKYIFLLILGGCVCKGGDGAPIMRSAMTINFAVIDMLY